MKSESKSLSKNPNPIKFLIGDSVMVKDGTPDPDDIRKTIGGWCGRIRELLDDNTALIEWDSIVIKEFRIAQIKKFEKQGIEWGEIYLGIDDLAKCNRRDKDGETAEEISKIRWKYFRKEYFPNTIEWSIPIIKNKNKTGFF